MRTVVLVAPHFLPSFLPSVHRSRLWAYHLAEFGWRPVILTTDPNYYECRVDWDLMDLLPDDLEIIRTKALPTRPVRIIGDIALRSFIWYYRELCRLARAGRMDFLHITIPASNAALLGPMIYRRFGVPYGIDYIDPWVQEFPREDPVWTKAGLSQLLAEWLEPIAVKKARLITGINQAYFASVLRRNPHLHEYAETSGMPYGGSDRDFDAIRKKPRKSFIFSPNTGKLHLIYAGAMLPKAFTVLDRLLAAVSLLRGSNRELAERLRIHFIGTGLYEGEATRGHTVKPYIEKHGLADMAEELPCRISYLDVLNHLQLSTAILVIGSTEAHYSPSKIYQSVMAQRPVFALLHEESTAVKTLRDSRAGDVFTFNEQMLPEPMRLAEALEHFLINFHYHPDQVNWEAFREVSARETTSLLAAALNRAFEREQRERASTTTVLKNTVSE